MNANCKHCGKLIVSEVLFKRVAWTHLLIEDGLLGYRCHRYGKEAEPIPAGGTLDYAIPMPAGCFPVNQEMEYASH